MSEKRNNAKRYYKLFGIAVFLITIFTFFQIQINSKIRDHPKIVTMEVNQKNIEKTLGEIRDELKELNRKMNELLRDEYGP